MSKNVNYEEYNSKKLSEIDGNNAVTHQTETRVSRTSSRLDNDLDQLCGIGSSRANSRLSEPYQVSYPPSSRRSSIASDRSCASNASTMRASGSDHSSNSSERTTDMLSDFDLMSTTGSVRDVDDDVMSVGSNRSRRSGAQSRRSKMSSLVHDSFDERVEDMMRGFSDRCVVQRTKKSAFWENRDDDDVMDTSSFFSDAFKDDFFSDTARMMKRRMRPSLMSTATSQSRMNRMRRMEEFDCEDSGISSETASTRSSLRDFDRRELEGEEEERRPKHRRRKQEMSSTTDKFSVSVDVTGFRPNELVVKTEGSKLVVCAEAKDDGDRKVTKERQFLAKQFRQEFELPEEVNPYEVVSSLGSDGLLKIEAPLSRPTSTADSYR